MMGFGDAVRSMGIGHKVSRSGWNGKGMFIFIVAGNCWEFSCDIEGVDGLDTLPFTCMKTADNKLIPWLASQEDVLAYDWVVLDEQGGYRVAKQELRKQSRKG